MKQALADFYLDYLNNYLTREKFAEDQQMTVEDATALLNLGRKYHEEQVQNLKEAT